VYRPSTPDIVPRRVPTTCTATCAMPWPDWASITRPTIRPVGAVGAGSCAAAGSVARPRDSNASRVRRITSVWVVGDPYPIVTDRMKRASGPSQFTHGTATTPSRRPGDAPRRGKEEGRSGDGAGTKQGRSRLLVASRQYEQACHALVPGQARPFGPRRGNQASIVVPRSGSLEAVTRPPWASTRCFTIARPRPVPPSSRERPVSTR
jgi:hypothetical protein